MPRKKKKVNYLLIFVILIAIAILFSTLFSVYNRLDKIKSNDIPINLSEENISVPYFYITPDEAHEIAYVFLSNNNFSNELSSYDYAVAENLDSIAYSFLEQTIGKDKVDNFTSENNLSYSYYTVRFFKELNVEEFYVDIDTYTGEVVGFSQAIPEDKLYINNELSKDFAKKVAFKYLIKLGYNTDSLQEKDYSKRTVESRIDHYFTFKITDSDFYTKYGISERVVMVDVFGDQVSGYTYKLDVPKDFSREVNKQLDSGYFLTLLSILSTLIMLLLALAVLIKKFIDKKVNWRFFLILSLFFLVFSILDLFNSYPSLKFQYITDSPYLVYIGSAIVGGIIFLILYAILIFVTGSAGESLTRELWPEKNGFLNFGLFSKRSSYSIFMGYVLAATSLGFTALIYYIGENYLGVWSLPGGNMSYFTFFPPLMVFVAAFFGSAIPEEIIYRLFGISFFKKYTKSTFLAMLIPTIIWAVAHCSYPVFPFYFRAIELIIGGMIFSFFFLKFDLTTVITGHYIINTILIGSSLFYSTNLLFKFSEMFLVVLPLIIAFIGLFRKDFKSRKVKFTK